MSRSCTPAASRDHTRRRFAWLKLARTIGGTRSLGSLHSSGRVSENRVSIRLSCVISADAGRSVESGRAEGQRWRACARRPDH
eukprot:6185071-Pleurochrysis_carterae.AAC.1